MTQLELAPPIQHEPINKFEFFQEDYLKGQEMKAAYEQAVELMQVQLNNIDRIDLIVSLQEELAAVLKRDDAAEAVEAMQNTGLGITSQVEKKYASVLAEITDLSLRIEAVKRS